MYQRNRVFFIHLPVSNQLESNNIIMTKLNDNSSSLTWNEDGNAFYQQLEKCCVEKLFSDQP